MFFVLAQLLKNAFPIYVGNLPNNIKKKRVLNAFKKFGTVLSIRFRTNNGKQINKKVKLDKVPFIIAFVYFKDQESAQKSLTMNGQKIGESIIKVDADLKESSPNYNPKCTIFVGNLKFGKSQFQSFDLFLLILSELISMYLSVYL